MGKFSDPNYDLLQRYFNTSSIGRQTGTQLSFIAGPRSGIWTDGGAFTVLYENNPTKGFVGHKFLIQAIDGNRFEMEYKGVYSDFKKYRTDTETMALSDLMLVMKCTSVRIVFSTHGLPDQKMKNTEIMSINKEPLLSSEKFGAVVIEAMIISMQ